MDVVTVLERDAIPSVDDPTFERAYEGEPTDELVVLEADPPKVYPVRILNFHEIVNDTVNEDPVAVTWCPLCGSAIVYDRIVGDQTLGFGVSGKLADDDLVMYDRETESEWKQSSGECIAGPLVGEQLSIRAAGMLTWEQFTDRYPAGVVLQPPHLPSEAASDGDEPAPVAYDENPYAEYTDGEGFGLAAHRGGESRPWDRTDLGPKTITLGIVHDGEAVGYPAPRVAESDGIVTDEVGGVSVVVTLDDGILHAYENPGYNFETAPDGLRADGTSWDPASGKSADGRRLSRVPARRLFAFTWQDDHGPDTFYS